MFNVEVQEYFKTLDKLGETVERLHRQLATEAVNFSKERFRKQNWVDNTTEPWKPRKAVKRETKQRSQRGILISSGRLRKSIRVLYSGRNMIIIGTDVPYAKAHNYGYRGRVKQQVRGHFRTTRKGRVVRVKSHGRNMNVNIPKRQFIGTSAVLQRRLQRRATAEFIKALKY